MRIRVTQLSLTLCSAAALMLAASGPALAATAGTCAPLTKMTPVEVGVNPGTQSIVIDTLKNQGFDKKYNLDITVRNFLNPPASAAAMIQGEVPIGYGSVTTMAIARAQGSGVVFFGPFLTTSPDGVFVLKDSPVQTLADLRGKKIGSFSGTSSATTATLIAIAAKSYDMPQLLKQADVIVAPDAALAGLADSKKIDAFMAGTTATVKARLSGKYREILNLAPDYTKAFGTNPMFLGLVTNDAFLKDHCDIITAYSKAQADTVEYIKTHDHVWTDYAKSIRMDEPGAGKALQSLSSAFTTEWGPAQVASVTELLENMIPILGEKNFVSKVPDGLFTTGYWPHD